MLTDARHLFQLIAALERPVLVPVLHDVLGQGFAHTRHMTQQRRAGRVQIHTHGVHAALDHVVELLGQLHLTHIMLIEPDADRFRVDFHQLGHRIQDPSRDGDVTALGGFQLRKFLFGDGGGRVHRGSRFAHNQILKLRKCVLDEIRHEFFGFTASGAVADGDQVHPMLGDHASKDGGRFGEFLVRLGGEDGVAVQILSGGIHHSHFAARPETRIDAHHHFVGQRRLHEQILHVFGEGGNGAQIGHFSEFVAQFALQRGKEQALERILVSLDKLIREDATVV